MTLDHLVAQIIGWANDRNLVQGSTVERQYVKLVEEHGEFAAGAARGKLEVMADALGDKMVIVAIMGAQANVRILHSLCKLTDTDGFSYEACKDTISNVMKDDSIGAEATFRENSYNIGILALELASPHLADILAAVFGDCIAAAVELGLDPNRVLEDVWNIIKDRKGRMVDGVFIKEGDTMMSGGSNAQA
jgi:NTP pyrophosphatase (non-canonical NTP hydrolase)